MEEKTRFGNLVRFMNKQRKEFEDEQQIQIQNEEMALNEYQHDQENNLARELNKMKSDEIRQLKLRQVYNIYLYLNNCDLKMDLDYQKVIKYLVLGLVLF